MIWVGFVFGYFFCYFGCLRCGRRRWRHLVPELSDFGAVSITINFFGFIKKQPGVVMIKAYFEEPLVFLLWVSAILSSFLVMMRNDGGHKQQGGGGRTNGFIPSSFRAISSYLRIVSSGASTVAKSAASVASSIVDRDDDASHDQV